MTTAATEAAALTAAYQAPPCPNCGARPLQPCVDPSGQQRDDHPSRAAAAESAAKIRSAEELAIIRYQDARWAAESADRTGSPHLVELLEAEIAALDEWTEISGASQPAPGRPVAEAKLLAAQGHRYGARHWYCQARIHYAKASKAARSVGDWAARETYMARSDEYNRLESDCICVDCLLDQAHEQAAMQRVRDQI